VLRGNTFSIQSNKGVEGNIAREAHREVKVNE